MKTQAYACYNLDDNERKKSSSGGIYVLLAKYMIRHNGIVFAACYDEHLEVTHEMITDLTQIEKSQGSKYVVSKLNNTYKEIGECLVQGKEVLFVGTPCQCAGLLSYLKQKQVDMTNLFSIDFVCHGIPVRLAWRKYKESIQKKGKKLKSVNMRDKSTGWSRYNYAWEYIDTDGERTVIHQNDVTYMKGFVSDIYLRPSCYECQFKGVDRETDITLADYWGVWDLQKEMDDNKGTSLLFVHSDKGEKVLKQLNASMKMEEVDLDAVTVRNPSILKSAVLTPKREKFFTLIQENDFEDVVRKVLKPESRLSQKIGRLINRKNNVEKEMDNQQKCCGCTGCYSICPAGAIVMQEDVEGCDYPVIDKNKCIQCHLCEKCCPTGNILL